MRSIFRTRFVLSVILLSLTIGACAPRQRDGVQRVPEEKPPELFDPFSYPGDTEIVTTASLDNEKAATEDSSLYYIATEPASVFSENVYRVLAFASQYYYEALEEKQIAEEIFEEKVRIDYQVPYYRVEIGNFHTREEASLLLRKARSLGYGESWLVDEVVDSLFWLTLASDSIMADSLVVDSLENILQDSL